MTRCANAFGAGMTATHLQLISIDVTNHFAEVRE